MRFHPDSQPPRAPPTAGRNVWMLKVVPRLCEIRTHNTQRPPQPGATNMTMLRIRPFASGTKT